MFTVMVYIYIGTGRYLADLDSVSEKKNFVCNSQMKES